MYTLLKTGLLLFFRESDLPTGTVSEAHLSELFEEFIQKLTAYSSDDRRSIIERLRCMNFTHKQLSLFEEQEHTASEPLITDYMVRTLFLIDMEVRLLHLRLRYPQSGIVPEVKIESPLYLSKDLTVTDLVELLKRPDIHRYLYPEVIVTVITIRLLQGIITQHSGNNLKITEVSMWV